jgi:hypothetical protein
MGYRSWAEQMRTAFDQDDAKAGNELTKPTVRP